jgi:hypothetical protein
MNPPRGDGRRCLDEREMLDVGMELDPKGRILLGQQGDGKSRRGEGVVVVVGSTSGGPRPARLHRRAA